MAIDIKDQKILFELCKNARQPSTMIAKKVGLSREVVEYRIKRLQKSGIIKNFITLIDVDLLGFKAYNIFLVMQNFNEEKEREITGYLSSHPAVRWMVTCFGKWDVVFRINVRDREQFDKVFNEICMRLGNNLRSFEVITSINKLKSVSPIELFYEYEAKEKEAKGKVDLTAVDLDILKEISNNSRKSLVELAGKIKLTPEAIKYRIKKLEKTGVIKVYSCLIDLEKLGYSWYLLLFSLNPMNKEEENSLKALIKYNKKVWFADKSIGRWNLMMEVLAKDTKGFHKTLIELRNKLGDRLNSFELLLVSKEHLNEGYSKLVDTGLRRGFAEKSRKEKL